VDLDAPVADNLKAIANGWIATVEKDLVIIVLDRPTARKSCGGYSRAGARGFD